MIGTNSILLLLTSIIVIVLIFLFVRNLVLWYYKIDKRTELLIEQNKLLKEIVEKLNNNKI